MAKKLQTIDATILRLSTEASVVAEVSALLWSVRTRPQLLEMLAALGVRQPSGKKFDRELLNAVLRELEHAGLLAPESRHHGYLRVADAARPRLYRNALARHPIEELRAGMHRANPPPHQRGFGRPHIDGEAAVEGQLRFAVLSGATYAEVEALRDWISEHYEYNTILHGALLNDLDLEQFARMQPAVAWYIVHECLARTYMQFAPSLDAAVTWTHAQLQENRDTVPLVIRQAYALHRLFAGDAEGMAAALEGLHTEAADLVRAGQHLRAGAWADAVAAFETVFERAQVRIGAVDGPRAKKAVGSKAVAAKPKDYSKAYGRDDLGLQFVWLYLPALLALGGAEAAQKLQRFIAAKSGKRTLPPYDPLGFWAHAAKAREGETVLDASAFYLDDPRPPRRHMGDLWRLLVLSWLGASARDAYLDKHAFDTSTAALANQTATAARACGLAWLADLAEAAGARLSGGEPATPYFVSRDQERWRALLHSLRALEDVPAAGTAKSAKRRVLWAVQCSSSGAVSSIEPFEQKRGARGWSRPAKLNLSKLANQAELPAWDAKVARAIRKSRYETRAYVLDRAAAAVALVGHPCIVLGDDFTRFVELELDTPEVEVLEQAGAFRIRLTPEPHPIEAPTKSRHALHYFDSPRVADDAEALQLISILKDAPQRARLVQYSAAQLRAHTLLSTSIEIPEAGRADLQQALRGLARHFRVHADAGAAVRTLPADSLLRAELSPLGDGLRLRLVAAPLGADGPRVEPGQGRTRLLANVAGEALATERVLQQERDHVSAVLDALPFLETLCHSPAASEWEIDNAEFALEAVETLGRMEAQLRIDWPKGTPVRVQRYDVPQLQVRVRAERDWFRVDTSLQVNEVQVLAFEQLLEAARGRSRYIAMGDGLYLALSHALKQRLADLASVVETHRHGHRVAAVGASWLRDLLDGAVLDADAGFRGALDALQRAQETEHALPPGLQAELRPYQEDGYRWAMRLADAGFGGCLADDMGLGKTLQALAVLCARAQGGAALVVAPTSVCGNWVAEAERFAPMLRVLDYASADRDAVLRDAGPRDLIVVSYALLLQDKALHEKLLGAQLDEDESASAKSSSANARFATRQWHTLIIDEAQAIKNPAAKRSIAIYELDAQFKLALSGTPVENRLAELWAILRFSTPGLLGTLARFNERFVGPIERERDREQLAVLRRLVAPFVLRRTKAQVLRELPQRTETVIHVVPDAREAAHYEALRRDATASIDQALAGGASSAQTRFNILAQLMRLRRAACDPRLVSPAYDGAGEKVEVFLRMATDLVANGHKALVFSQFVDFLQVLRDALDAAGIRFQTLDGSTPAAERTRRVNAFQAGDGDLFLISLKAGGLGLNLTAADYVLIMDPWWNPAVEDQATGRAHRIGQRRPVTVYRLVNKGSIEERIVELHRDKRELADGILEGGDVATPLSTDVLIGLMRGDE